eukprot:6979646-Heterocapsa_arctica.AAC.1
MSLAALYLTAMGSEARCLVLSATLSTQLPSLLRLSMAMPSASATLGRNLLRAYVVNRAASTSGMAKGATHNIVLRYLTKLP